MGANASHRLKKTAAGKIQRSAHLTGEAWKARRWFRPNWTQGQQHDIALAPGERWQANVDV